MMENKTKIDLKNTSIFITGAAGFIGSNLAKRILTTVEGAKVVGLDNMNHYYDVRLKEARLDELNKFENFSFVKGNLADKETITTIFEQYKPQIVVNLGAQAGVRYSITNPDAYVEANLIGFYNILEACRHSYDEGHTPVEHLVYASSSSVYGSNKKVPYSTDGCYMKERGKLLTNTVVTTVMSNFGLYKAFDEQGIGYAKTAVGDKYVYEYMAKNGCRIGGEQSGHIIFSKYASTGDGILTSLKMMEVMLAKKKPMSELAAPLKIYPQVLENVRVTDKKAAQNDPAVQEAVNKVAETLGDTGRILWQSGKIAFCFSISI